VAYFKVLSQYFQVLTQYFFAATDRNHDSKYGNTILESKFEAELP